MKMPQIPHGKVVGGPDGWTPSTEQEHFMETKHLDSHTDRDKSDRLMMMPAIFTLDIGGRPILSFEAKNLREAWEVCHELWLREDVARLRSNGIALWDGIATLRSRSATESEQKVYREAAKGAGPALDELVLAYLVELDSETL